MSSGLHPAQSDHSDTSGDNSTDVSGSHSAQQQSAGMAYGDTPQNNAYEQGKANNESQNDANNASGGGRSRRRRRHHARRRSSKKSSKRTRSRRSRRSSKRRVSHKLRHNKSKKGRKGKKTRKGRKSLRGGSGCGPGMVLAEVGHTIYPDRSGGDQTVEAQTTLAQSNTMNMAAQSKLDSHVPEPPQP